MTELNEVIYKYSLAKEAGSAAEAAFLSALYHQQRDLYDQAVEAGVIPQWVENNIGTNSRAARGRGEASNGNLTTLDKQVGQLNMVNINADSLAKIREPLADPTDEEEDDDIEIEEKKGSSLIYEQNGSMKKSVKYGIIAAVALILIGGFFYLKNKK